MRKDIALATFYHDNQHTRRQSQAKDSFFKRNTSNKHNVSSRYLKCVGHLWNFNLQDFLQLSKPNIKLPDMKIANQVKIYPTLIVQLNIIHTPYIKGTYWKNKMMQLYVCTIRLQHNQQYCRIPATEWYSGIEHGPSFAARR